MKQKNTITIRENGQLREIPLVSPKPRWQPGTDTLIVHTPEGQKRLERRQIVGWRWNGSLH